MDETLPLTDGATNGTTRHWDSSSVVPLWLNGKEVTTSSTFDVDSPVTNKLAWKCSAATKEDAVAAVEAAQKAFPAWSKTKPKERRDIFLRAADDVDRRSAELRSYAETEMGVAEPMIMFMLATFSDFLRDTAGKLSLATVGSIPEVAQEGQHAMVYKEPYGVCLGISPWNGPYVLQIRAVLMPLAAGNTVVLKNSEFSPMVMWAVSDVLHKAGLPPGCLNTIYHRPSDASEITTALIAHPSVKKVNFTGSTAVGSIVASLCGKHLKPCLMELGGKASSIVFNDAEIKNAAVQCALGAFMATGQICMSTERILVQKELMSNFQGELKVAIDNVFGDSSKPAPVLVRSPPVEKNKKLLKDATSKGAKVVYGDIDAHEDSPTRMRPVVIDSITKEMDIYATESFGPTVSLYPFETEEEAIELANDTEYGLAGAIFTEDLRKGFRVARAVQSGAVHINSMSIHDEVALPHGGWKKSGWGRFNGVQGLEEWVQSKTVTWK
ncbi:MAG: hypothetical protein Q9227_000287 [Pyrenula ochraceoflavens]